MRLTAALTGLFLAAAVSACGGDSYDPGEEVWISLNGDAAIHQGYALAIVIGQREDLVEIQVNVLQGGEGDEYLSVLRRGRAFVPVRLVQSRRDGLLDARRKRETIAHYREILSDDGSPPRPVSDKAMDRAEQYGMRDVELTFGLQSILVDGVVGAEDKIDVERARGNAPRMLREIKKRLDDATGEKSEAEVLVAIVAAGKPPAADRAEAPQAPLAHGLRVARRVLALALTARDGLSIATPTAARNLAAAVDAYAEFGWRYDPRIREAVRRLNVPTAAAAKVRMRQFYFKDVLARLRDRTIARAAQGLSPPVSDAQIDAKFAAARAETADISDSLGLPVIPPVAREAFARALRASVRKLADDARVNYIRSNADRIVLAGNWSGRAVCPAGRGGTSFPLALDLRLDLNLASEGVGVFQGSLTAKATPTATTASDTDKWSLLRRFVPIGPIPGEGVARGAVRVRVDTRTGELRWIQVMNWTAGPPILRVRMAAETGVLEWHRPVRFFIDVCGQRLAMKKAAPVPAGR